MLSFDQNEFDLTIGQLDRVLSKLVSWGMVTKEPICMIDRYNCQTLKHHAEDMIAAGEKILKDIGVKS
jgi:hypothetical protein